MQFANKAQHYILNRFAIRYINKMLSYRRETALQGALQFSPKVEDWTGRQYFTDIIGLSSTTVI